MRAKLNQWIAAVVAAQWLELEELDQVLGWPELTGLDVRIQRRGRPSTFEKNLAKRVLDAGKRLRCHTWMGVEGSDGASKATYRDGIRQGEELAQDALMLGAEAAAANNEKDVWRGPKGFANPKAVDFLEGEADGFARGRGTCAALELHELGLAVPAWHYKKADLDKDGDLDTTIPAETALRFPRKGVMAYQVDDSPTLVEDQELRDALTRAKKVWPQKLGVWLGVGRIDEHGRVWGDYAAAKAILADRHAGIDEVTWYVGYGAIGQVLLGHPRHPALVEILPEVAGL